MTAAEVIAFDVEDGLIELAGTPPLWIWAFTCPTRECSCRVALVISSGAEQAHLLERGRPVADAWRSGGHYGRAAENLDGATAFAVDLDSRAFFPPVGDAPLDPRGYPEVNAIADRLDDDVLDQIARIWHRGKGQMPRPEPGAGGGAIEVEGFRPGDVVVWEDARPALRGDTYRFGERLHEAVESYCVEPECSCGDVIVDFRPVLPRGAPHPGHVEYDGEDEAAILRPKHERHRARLTELWTAYCQRHVRYRERLARRSATMHALARRIVAAPRRSK